MARRKETMARPAGVRLATARNETPGHYREVVVPTEVWQAITSLAERSGYSGWFDYLDRKDAAEFVKAVRAGLEAGAVGNVYSRYASCLSGPGKEKAPTVPPALVENRAALDDVLALLSLDRGVSVQRGTY